MRDGQARVLQQDGDVVVLIAPERYGTGSSRDRVTKGQRLLGIRAVLALDIRPGDKVAVDAAPKNGHTLDALSNISNVLEP